MKSFEVSIPSNRGVLSNNLACMFATQAQLSQSPRIGEFFPTEAVSPVVLWMDESQSPRIGEFFPTKWIILKNYDCRSLNPLESGSSFQLDREYMYRVGEKVSIPSNRGVLSNCSR
ncbi:MAG: hypothetical protein SRB2_03602 [Desulfobacteraceae bacterium Eth-SRB2]|nr:MAG: hypothetical protein SRB2_03602 [Desulfobacteraceae bacterium Eth-SRB2]